MYFIKKNKKKIYVKDIVCNRKIRYNYFIIETIEAGLVLEGWEIKSIRSFKINIENSYISIRDQEAYLIGANIFPLHKSSVCDFFDYKRIRKILLRSNEINYLSGKTKIKGYSLVVLSVYLQNAWCKIKIGLVKGKKKFDKRYDIKNREWNIRKSKILKKNIKFLK